jgi:hypothetical protein
MTHFEAYRWEDHVPRAGSWKFNLAAGVLALGLIYTTLPAAGGDAAAAIATAPVHRLETLHGASSAIQPVTNRWAYCRTQAAGSADS